MKYKFTTALIAIFIAFFYLSCTKDVFASDDFKIDIASHYTVSENGQSTAVNAITIENLTTEVQATQFIFNLRGVNPENIKVSEGEKNLDYETLIKGNHVSVAVNFDEKVVGVGEKRIFKIAYSEQSIVTRTGEIWEVSIPKLEDDTLFDTYSVSITVPESFGNIAYINPNPSEKTTENQNNTFYFTQNIIRKSGIAAGFGKFQVYAFKLTYHLENTSTEKKEQTIAIPPDTAYQRLHYTNITPKPLQVNVDEDGNWMAVYALSAKQNLDITVEGNAQIFASPRKHLIPQPSNIISNLKPSEYWQSDSQIIKDLALQLKSPENIYNYVVDTLNYDYGRTKDINQRYGALVSLSQSASATCTEFTDLFIAIARAAGIPAREVNGYAVSENPEKEPLLDNSDILHAWAEYWDDNTKAWIPIDPTWGDTSNLNYFSQFDLKHIAFVIHGKSAKLPYPPGFYKGQENPQKDVFVTIGEFSENLISNPVLTAEIGGLTPFTRKVTYAIYNPGPTAMYDTYVESYFNKTVKSSEFIKILSPFATYTFEVEIPYSPLSSQSPNKLSLSVAGYELTINGPRKQDMSIQILAILFLFLIFILKTVLKHFNIKPLAYLKTVITRQAKPY